MSRDNMPGVVVSEVKEWWQYYAVKCSDAVAVFVTRLFEVWLLFGIIMSWQVRRVWEG